MNADKVAAELTKRGFVTIVKSVPKEFGGPKRYLQIHGVNTSTRFWLPAHDIWTEDECVEHALKLAKLHLLVAYKQPAKKKPPLAPATHSVTGVLAPKVDLSQTVTTPDGHCYTLRQAIIHLNDHFKWTREQIADWLEAQDVDLRIK